MYGAFVVEPNYKASMKVLKYADFDVGVTRFLLSTSAPKTRWRDATKHGDASETEDVMKAL